jgi:peptidoglycan/LPS O-acetylase OafA/YrhL
MSRNPAGVVRGEIKSLTGLRGVAALLVTIAHYWIWARVTRTTDTLPAEAATWVDISGIGMAVFFTLSGYVIALSYSHWDWQARPLFNLVRLFFYRFARLYPAFLVFVGVAMLWHPELIDLSNPAQRDYVVPHLLLWQSWWPVKFDGELAAHDSFHVSWSLSVECALYLAFGLGAIIVAVLPSWRFKGLLLGALGFAAVWWTVKAAWIWHDMLMPAGWTEGDWWQWLFYYSPCFVALQFGIGVAAYRISRLPLPSKMTRLASELGAVGLLMIYLMIGTGQIAHGSEATITALATASLMVGAMSDSIANRVLSGRAIVYVGTISYSLYLFHFMAPAMALHGMSVETYTGTVATYHALNILASLLLAILIATGVYHLVEIPGRRAIRAAADKVLSHVGPLSNSSVASLER